MQSTAQSGTRVAKILETEQDAVRFHQHLKEVVEGEAFKGSHRAGQFLTYIVEESIAGRFAALKERIIGVKLFGRAPTYDTGEDAIVRVTASDVRKRLLQHYGKYGVTSEFRISLPLGSYIPEITREPPKAASVRNPVAIPEVPVTTPEPAPHIVPLIETPAPRSRRRVRWLFLGVLVIACNALVWGLFWNHFSRPGLRASFHPSLVSIFPLSAFHQVDHQ